MDVLKDKGQLQCSLDIRDAAAPLEVTVDLGRRTVDVGMTMGAPEDKKSSKARLSWLLRQIKTKETTDLHIRLMWPGRSEPTQFTFQQLNDDPGLCEVDKGNLQVRAFHVFYTKHLGAKFAQQTNFISELETIVPAFYREVGQRLVMWRKSAPKIKDDRNTADKVDVEVIRLEADSSYAEPVTDQEDDKQKK